jgi:hypothetical protein
MKKIRLRGEGDTPKLKKWNIYPLCTMLLFIIVLPFVNLNTTFLI